MPKIIETEAEYEQTLATVEALTLNHNRTPEQTALYKLLVPDGRKEPTIKG
jgi:hypothetical protein